MRADRLVAVLLMLQRRGRVTAAEVAQELEVSERTARRDLEALSMAGLPVYSTQGRGGGWHLLGDGRTDLSGLSANEARALFVVAGPLAVTPELRAALRKLVRALPEPLRDRAEAAAGAVVVDPGGWTGHHTSSRGTGSWAGTGWANPEPEHLTAVQDAVIDARQIMVDYVDRTGTPTRRIVDPYGLAAKAGRWYLVAGTAGGRRTFRVDRIRGVETTGAVVSRPVDFDLTSAWDDITAGVDELRFTARARLAADPGIVSTLRLVFGTRLRLGPTAGAERVEAEVRGWDDYSLAAELAGFAQSVEVVGPPSIRSILATLGAALVSTYADRPR